MSSQRWEEIQHLFAAALDQPPEQRSRFVKEQCNGDEALRREVDSLLTARLQAESFLEEPALHVAALGSATRRAVVAGESAGPYQLTSLLGKGGMGEVWRAYDPRVGREVAIKFSNIQFTERFGREARAIAALNHPNICQLYDVGPDYLVMELAEGDSPSGPLPLGTVLHYARQIADALEAAHEKGIVHRDLKTANIRVRPDGTVKVLDFGLAKVLESSKSGHEGPSSNAALKTLTVDGSILGTPAWMSPEQTRGQHVDKRTDIWAFGVLLYDLLTGATPFQRATLSDTQSAVLTSEPDIETLPAEIRRMVRKCLEKDLKNRLRDIGDVWELLDEPGVEAGHRSSGWTRQWGLIVAAIVVAGAIAAASFRSLLPRIVESKELMRFDLDLGPDVSLEISGASNMVLSPDGSRLAFVSRGKLFLHQFNDAPPNQVGSVQGVHTPFFSPDGQWIAFFGQGKLRKISVKGGAPIDISPTSAYYSGGAWGSDGNIIAALSPSGPLQQVPAEGGEPRPLTRLDQSRGEVTHRLPQYLPGGRALLFTSHNAITGFEDADIDVLTFPDRRRKHLIHGAMFGRYVQSGHLLYVSRGVLYAVPFDVARLELRGEPVPVVQNVAYSLYGSAQVDAAAGILVYRKGGSALGNVMLQKLNRSGGEEPLLSAAGTYINPRVSPDGQRILISSRETKDLTLSVYDSRRGVLNELVQYPPGDPSAIWAPLAIWTPDAKFVVFRGDGGMFWIRSDSAGEPRRLTTSTQSQTPSSFTPDGRTLAYHQGAGLVGHSDIWTTTIESTGTELRARDAQPFLKTRADENHPTFSPDGRWVAYAASDASAPQIWVRPWPDDGRSWQISSDGGSQPLFARSGSELFFLNQDLQVMVVSYRIAGGTFVADRPRLWSDRRVASLGTTFWSYDVMPKGDAIAALMLPEVTQRNRAENRLTVLVNFFDHLKRMTPAK